ncbi:uncharacterized protein [Danio rerio]|uniref:Uncharacterized protein n=1 Tax=Danio rerio TaxID=7955 RepID=A0AB32T9L3_DANRE|nr:coiled-coil domain-containing protein 106-like [Danio rerio]|eukprot:XP_021324278.1 coiled-coil domain-containing protein 106-like [Danio rerio]
MFRKRKTKRLRTLAVPALDINAVVTDEDREVTFSKQSVDCENKPEDSSPVASYSLDESEKGLQAASEGPTVEILLEKIKSLEEERDFLRRTLGSVCGKEKKKKKKDTSSDSDELPSSSSSSSSLSSSSSEDERCHRKKSKKKKPPPKRSRSTFSCSTVRAKSPEDVLKRYKKVLRAYNKEGSMTRAFTKVGVDRNTLALSAVIAEIQIVDPEFYRSLPQFQPQQEKLFEFAQRCSEALNTEVKASIFSAKQSGKLLPIKYKFR